MHEAEDRHADEFLRRVTQQPLDRARASEDAAFAVELEHERIGRVGDEAARVLLLRQRLPELELRLRAAAQAKREDEDQEEDRQACDCGAGGNERGGGGGRERDPPRTSADLGARDGRAARPVREDGGAVGDPHVEPLRQAGERGRGELVRRERADDDAEQGVAPLRGRIERQVTGEDGDEANVPRPPLRSSRTGAERRARPVPRALRSALPRDGSEPRSSTFDESPAGSWRRSGYVKRVSGGAPIRTCSPASSATRSAAETRGAQPTATISGRASGTRAWVANAFASTEPDAS